MFLEVIIMLGFVILAIITVAKYQVHSFPYLILFNVGMDIAIGLVSPGEANNTVLLGLLRLIICLPWILFILMKLGVLVLRYSVPFIVFIIVLFITGLNSSEFFTTYSKVFKILLYALIFPCSLVYYKRYAKESFFLYIVDVSILMYNLNFFIANIFKIGSSSYSEGLFFAGGIHIGALNTLPLFLLSYSIKDIGNYNRGSLKILNALCLLIFLILSAKRTPIFMVGIGLILYFLASTPIKRLKLLIASILFASLSMLIVGQRVVEQFESRGNYIKAENIQEESRFLELVFFLDEFRHDFTMKRKLFGDELFNSPGNYAGGFFGPRELHTDHGKLLYGGGVVSWSLYVLTFVYIFWLLKRSKANGYMPYVFSVFLSLCLATLAEGILAVSFKSTGYYILGMGAGIFKRDN